RSGVRGEMIIDRRRRRDKVHKAATTAERESTPPIVGAGDADPRDGPEEDAGPKERSVMTEHMGAAVHHPGTAPLPAEDLDLLCMRNLLDAAEAVIHFKDAQGR